MPYSAIPGLILEAAAEGNLERLKSIASNFSNGETFRQMCETVKNEYGWTALHHAAGEGKTHICKYLIENVKLNVNFKTYEGYTPLIIANMFNHSPTAMYLIKRGADVKESSNDGMTALHFAAESGNKEVMKLLISKGADLEAISLGGTPLQFATCHSKLDAIRILLDHKADPNSASTMFYTPIMLSIMAGSLESLAILLKVGADPNIMSWGMVPLHMAASKLEAEFVKLLLVAGADPNVVNATGETPLEHAAIFSNYGGVMILLPVTSPISSFPDWSINGIMRQVNSRAHTEQSVVNLKEHFLLAKQRGAMAFKKNDYMNAIFSYNEAFYFSMATDATMLSNISLCWARRGVGDCALASALACIKLKPDWLKAHYREGVAWMLLKDYSMAAEAFSQALRFDPKNKEIHKALMDAVEAKLKQQGL